MCTHDVCARMCVLYHWAMAIKVCSERALREAHPCAELGILGQVSGHHGGVYRRTMTQMMINTPTHCTRTPIRWPQVLVQLAAAADARRQTQHYVLPALSHTHKRTHARRCWCSWRRRRTHGDRHSTISSKCSRAPSAASRMQVGGVCVPASSGRALCRTHIPGDRKNKMQKQKCRRQWTCLY